MRRAGFVMLCFAAACSFDTERPAPYLAPPKQAGLCGTTETLLPKLLELLRSGRFEPLRRVIESHLVPSERNPSPDPSLRSLIGALVDLSTGLGLERTVDTASIAISTRAIRDLRPLIVTGLRFTAGELDGKPHYESTEAIAELVDRCDPNHLLSAMQALLTLRGPGQSDRFFLSFVGEQGSELLRDPELEPFVSSFERESERGRPAIISLLDQILAFLADENFDISRVRTLLESAVYPAIAEPLRIKIERMVDLLEYATSDRAGILQPVQRAVRCVVAHPEAKHELSGFLYDLITIREVGLRSLLESVRGVIDDRESAKVLSFGADLVKVLQDERDTREQILGLLVLLLRRPEASEVMPLWIEIFEQDVLVELLEAVQTLLSGCGRAS
jgi:hypothetical protein